MSEQAADAVRNGQPQPQPLYRLTALLWKALKLPEDLLVLIIGNTRAGVPHVNANGIVLAPTAKQDAAMLGITNGIGQQVLQHTPQQALITFHHRITDHRTQA